MGDFLSWNPSVKVKIETILHTRKNDKTPTFQLRFSNLVGWIFSQETTSTQGEHYIKCLLEVSLCENYVYHPDSSLLLYHTLSAWVSASWGGITALCFCVFATRLRTHYFRIFLMIPLAYTAHFIDAVLLIHFRHVFCGFGNVQQRLADLSECSGTQSSEFGSFFSLYQMHAEAWMRTIMKLNWKMLLEEGKLHTWLFKSVWCNGFWWWSLLAAMNSSFKAICSICMIFFIVMCWRKSYGARIYSTAYDIVCGWCLPHASNFNSNCVCVCNPNDLSIQIKSSCQDMAQVSPGKSFKQESTTRCSAFIRFWRIHICKTLYDGMRRLDRMERTWELYTDRFFHGINWLSNSHLAHIYRSRRNC